MDSGLVRREAHSAGRGAVGNYRSMKLVATRETPIAVQGREIQHRHQQAA